MLFIVLMWKVLIRLALQAMIGDYIHQLAQ